MNRSEEFFFTLLRCAIWDIEPELKYIPNEEEWNDIYRISKEQTVTGLLLDSISKLPKTHRPPQQLLLQWIMIQKFIEKKNISMNKELINIVKELELENTTTFLLKGQGIAQNYPKPEHRMCGDIDIYFEKKDFENAVRFFSNNGCNIEDEPHSSHAETEYNGFKIEIHKKSATFYTKILQEKYDSITAGIICNKKEHVTIEDKEINVLPVMADALQLLSHMLRHIIFSGIGLRQICDWVLFVNKHHKELNNEEFVTYMKELELYGTYNAIMVIAIELLGLPKQYVVCDISKKDKLLAQKVLNLIMSYGNFGIYSDHYIPSTKWEYLKSYMWKVRNCFRFRRLSKSETWNYPIWQLHSIRKLIKQ